MHEDAITSSLMISDPVTLRAEVESYGFARGRPGELVPVLSYRLAFSMGERRISLHDYPRGPGHALLKGNILDDPVRLALHAQTEPGRERGLLRIALWAAPTTMIQEALLLDADRSLPETMALRPLPDDQVGFPIGERWFPADEELLTPIPVDDDTPQRLLVHTRRLQPYFHQILYGQPSEEVERLLRSVEAGSE